MKENVKNVTNGMGVFGWLFIILFWLKMNPGGNYTTPVAGIFYAIANKD